MDTEPALRLGKEKRSSRESIAAARVTAPKIAL
jgi:hypothetical protein